MPKIGGFIAFPFVLLLIYGLFNFYINSTNANLEHYVESESQKAEEKMKENPSIFESEFITDIKFTSEKAFLSKEQKIIVSTDSQTHVFNEGFIDFNISNTNKSYLETEIRFPQTDDEVHIKRIFISKEDMPTYSEKYSLTFGATLPIKND